MGPQSGGFGSTYTVSDHTPAVQSGMSPSSQSGAFGLADPAPRNCSLRECYRQYFFFFYRRSWFQKGTEEAEVIWDASTGHNVTAVMKTNQGALQQRPCRKPNVSVPRTPTDRTAVVRGATAPPRMTNNNRMKSALKPPHVCSSHLSFPPRQMWQIGTSWN